MNEHTRYPATSSDIKLGELTDTLGFMLRMAQVTSYSQFFQQNQNATLLPGEFSVLWVVGLNPGIRQGDVARVLNIKRAHMTKLVKGFLSAGLLERQASTEDRRSVLLTLSEMGRKEVEAHKKNYVNFYSKETPNLSQEESKMLLHFLRKFAGFERDQQ